MDAYHFPQEEKSNFITWRFSEEPEEYGGEDSSIISRESTPLPAISISEFEDDDDIYTTTPQNDASESGDEAVHRRKPEQRTDYSRSEDVEICTSPGQSVSDVDDEESASDVDDEASSPEPQELSTIYECDEEFEDNQQDDEPREADSPKPQQLSPLHKPHPEFNNQQDNEPLEADSPEPPRLSTLHYSHLLDFDDEKQDDEPHEADSPESQLLFTLHQSHPAEFEDEQQDDDESIESNSPEPRRLFPFRLPEFEAYQPSGSEIEEGYCPGPMRRFLTPESILKLDAFEEWFVQMSEWIFFRNAAAAFSPEESIISETASSSPEPRRLFPVHQFHSTLYDPEPPSAPTPQRDTDIFCPKPMRQYPTHKVILQPELFEDWFVDMSEHIFIDEAVNISPDQQSISERPSRPIEAEKLFFPVVVHESTYPEFNDDGMKGDEPLEVDNSLEPRRILSLSQIDSSLYHDPYQAVSELDDEEALESFEYIPLESLNLLGF